MPRTTLNGAQFQFRVAPLSHRADARAGQLQVDLYLDRTRLDETRHLHSYHGRHLEYQYCRGSRARKYASLSAWLPAVTISRLQGLPYRLLENITHTRWRAALIPTTPWCFGPGVAASKKKHGSLRSSYSRRMAEHSRSPEHLPIHFRPECTSDQASSMSPGRCCPVNADDWKLRGSSRRRKNNQNLLGSCCKDLSWPDNLTSFSKHPGRSPHQPADLQNAVPDIRFTRSLILLQPWSTDRQD